MRTIFAAFGIMAIVSHALADETEKVRVIPLSKENAASSAAVIASAKSPLIGAPPPGRLVQRFSLSESQRPMTQSFANARAELTDSRDQVAAPAPDERGLKRVEVLKPSPTGGFTVQTYFVK